MLEKFKESLKKELQIVCGACGKRHTASAVYCPHCGLHRGKQIKPS